MVLERPRRAARLTALLVALMFAGGFSAQAAPIIHESGWSLIRTVSINNPNSARYNPVDGLLYAAVTTNELIDGGLYRINADGTSTKVVAAERPVGVVIDPSTGNVFYSTPGNPGAIYRYVLGSGGTQDLWVSGFHPGDDDPIGLAFAPSNYTGAHLLPGQAVVVDEGTGGPDEVWGWNFGSQEGEFGIHRDFGSSPLVQGVDVAVSATDIWIADLGDSSNPGAIWQVTAAGGLVQLTTSVALGKIAAIAVDPITGDLILIDKSSDEVLRVDPNTGNVSVMFSGFSFIDCCTEFAGLDFTPDGSRLIVTDRGGSAIYEFLRVPEPAMLLLAAVAGCWFSQRRRQAV